MTLVERLRAQWAALDPVDEYRVDVAEAADRIEQLEAENAALREDAERYRWLRDQPMYPTWKLIAAASNNREAIIDAAMGKFQASPIDSARSQP